MQRQRRVRCGATVRQRVRIVESWGSDSVMTGASTRLAVLSPRRLVRDALCAYLAGRPEFDVVGQTADLDGLHTLCALRQPDTVLVDVERLGLDTVSELSQLRGAFPSIQLVVMYTEVAPRALAAAASAELTELVPGTRGLAGVVRALRPAGGSHRPTPGALALTERELEILGLLAAGHSGPDIAQRLRVTTRTVENHKRRIYVKLGVGNQIHAVARATSLGLLEPDPSGPPPREPQVESGRAPLVTVCGPPGRCLTDVTTALVARGLPVAYLRTPVLDGREHWLLWHRGPRPVVLIDPTPGAWQLVEALRGPVVLVWSVQPDLADMVDALLRGVRALVRPPDVLTELPAALWLVSRGYVAFPASQFDELAQLLAGRLDEWPGGVPELTPRERDILGSIARGHTVRQTARMLGIAAKTVENTQARLFRKLGAHNRSAALTNAYRLGLVEPVGEQWQRPTG
jgi:two-component system, NarL family, nitrate/nitrite response regulator NarL